jgi:hypothetical protein
MIENICFFYRVNWNLLQPRFAMGANNLPNLDTTEGYILQAFLGKNKKKGGGASCQTDWSIK